MTFQYQLQQENYNQIDRQRQYNAAQSNNGNQAPYPQGPRQFAQTTPSTLDYSSTVTNTEEDRAESTTELSLNEGETIDASSNSNRKEKTAVEVTKQKLQEYPGELLLSSLAQLRLQPQLLSLQQFGQLKAPLYYQPTQQESQKQVAGYDAATHFAALSSVLAQRQAAQPQEMNPALLLSSQNSINAAFIQPQYNQYQPAQPQYQSFQPTAQQNQANQLAQQPEANNEAPRQEDEQFQYQQSYQPQEVIYQPEAQPNQYQPQPNQYQPQTNQYQPQPNQYQPQPNQYQPQPSQYQPQPDQYQPQLPQDQQNFYQQPQLVGYPNQIPQAYYPQEFMAQEPQGFQEQDALQSGLDENQEGNGVEMEDREDADDEDDGSTATAVATAFGARSVIHIEF
jgi:hypothetical protein